MIEMGVREDRSADRADAPASRSDRDFMATVLRAEAAIGRNLRRHFAESEPELIGCEDTYLLAGRFVRRWERESEP
jgi:hypothetical protein